MGGKRTTQNHTSVPFAKISPSPFTLFSFYHSKHEAGKKERRSQKTLYLSLTS